jgi:hypothetical protein
MKNKRTGNMIDGYYPGKGCRCYAHSESECACPEVDWTDPEVYKLRDELKKVKAQRDEAIELIKDLMPFAEFDLDNDRFGTITGIQSRFEELMLELSKE